MLRSILQDSYTKLISTASCRFYSQQEVYFFLEDNVVDPIIFVNHTQNVNDDIMKLVSLLELLNFNNYVPIIILPLMPYSRQDKREKSKSYGLKIFADILNNYNIEKIITFDLHNTETIKLFSCPVFNVMPHILFKDIFCKISCDVVISTDSGGINRSMEVAKILEKPFIALKKIRDINGNVKHYFKEKQNSFPTALIVDDIIDGGRTIKSVLELLEKEGYLLVSILVTHILSIDYLEEILYNKRLDKVYTLSRIRHPKIVSVANSWDVL